MKRRTYVFAIVLVAITTAPVIANSDERSVTGEMVQPRQISAEILLIFQKDIEGQEVQRLQW